MNTITIVTGLPRSGTSLMMQILNKSSLPLLIDGVRKKDINNPKGYFELEVVKKIVKDNSFLLEAQGKAVKIVCPLPMYLDLNLKYRVIVMRRNMEEILSSQEKMLNKDQSGVKISFSKIYSNHLDKMYAFFDKNKIEYIDVWYPDLIANSDNILDGVVKFCKLENNLKELKSVISPDLYRNKNEAK